MIAIALMAARPLKNEIIRIQINFCAIKIWRTCFLAFAVRYGYARMNLDVYKSLSEYL